jgi:hypothetical protein
MSLRIRYQSRKAIGEITSHRGLEFAVTNPRALSSMQNSPDCGSIGRKSIAGIAISYDLLCTRNQRIKFSTDAAATRGLISRQLLDT